MFTISLIMNSKKIRPGGRQKGTLIRLIVLIVVLFNSLLSGSLIKPSPVQAASGFSSQLNFNDPPFDTSDEYGIWVDRARIMIYQSSTPITDDIEDGDLGGQKFEADPNEGLNGGTVEYISGCQSLTVTFDNAEDNPDSGQLTKCDGTPVGVTLLNKDYATIDGYISEDSEKIDMVRYVNGINGCGTFDTGGNLSGDYKSDGTFEKDGSVWKLTGNTSAVVYDYNSNGSNRAGRAKQKKTSSCNSIGRVTPSALVAAGIVITGGSNATISYAGGSSGGRPVNILKGFNRGQVTTAVENKIDNYNAIRGRISRLTQYFQDSSAGQAAITKCKNDTGTTGDRAAIVQYLAQNNQAGLNPFTDCMLRELEGDQDFEDALNFNYSGNFDTDIIADTSENCGSAGPPIIGPMACWAVEYVYDALFAGFKTVIDYFASPSDMFTDQNSTLEQSMKNLRNFANIIFVLAFLVVVFQYMTNISVVDAYFIKKFIPRLVIAVILVQAAFFITAELNAFFFDLGQSVQTIVFQDTSPGELAVTNGAATIALVYALALGPALLGLVLVLGIIMLLVLLVTIIVLSIRYVLIIVLAILAPLAFAALAIPQLEGVTKKWFNMYIKLLLMYPIIMFFIAASAVVAGAISGGGTIMAFLSLVVAFLPFIILPFTFKFAGGIMGTVTAKLGSLAKKGAKMGYNQGRKAYDNSYTGMKRAKEKEIKKGIKADRASTAATGTFMRKVDGMSPARRRRLFGSDEEKYMGILQDRETKRLKEEAESELATKLLRGKDQTEKKRIMDRHYREAMARGDYHAAGAAYDQLVGAKAHEELAAIQADAVRGVDSSVGTSTSGAVWGDAGRAAYNKQQGDNFSKLGEFGAHLRGDVSATTDLDAHRAKNLRDLSADELAIAPAKTWEAYHAVAPTEATERWVNIHAAGGSPATKLKPEAKAILATDPNVIATMNESDADIAARLAGIPLGARTAAIDAAKAQRDKYKAAFS